LMRTLLLGGASGLIQAFVVLLFSCFGFDLLGVCFVCCSRSGDGGQYDNDGSSSCSALAVGGSAGMCTSLSTRTSTRATCGA
jgi:hypothetical protein